MVGVPPDERAEWARDRGVLPTVHSEMPEDLAGGYRSAARREGDTVDRGATSQYAVELLEFLTAHEWPYSPALISSNPEGSVVAYIDGTAAITPSSALLRPKTTLSPQPLGSFASCRT